MPHISKRRKVFASKVDHAKAYPAMEAMKLVKETATAKFDEAVDVAVNLGIDAKKGDQTVRGSVVLPAGTGKKIRVAVFAPGDKATAAKAAGADLVGMEDLAEQVKAGKIDFDVVIAAPEAMRVVGSLGQILGPRGLMPNPKVGTVTPDVAGAVRNAKAGQGRGPRGRSPNPKVGTVTPDVAGAVRNAKAGQVQFRADKSGIVQCTIGRASFTPEQLRDNLAALLDALNKSKPSATKGIFLKKVSVSSTMGMGVKVDPSSLSAQQ